MLMASSWTYCFTLTVLPVWPFSCGQASTSRSVLSMDREKKLGLSWMSDTPGSQYRRRMSMHRMAMSPTPPRAVESQKIPLTPVPCLSLRHQLSDHTCS